MLTPPSTESPGTLRGKADGAESSTIFATPLQINMKDIKTNKALEHLISPDLDSPLRTNPY